MTQTCALGVHETNGHSHSGVPMDKHRDTGVPTADAESALAFTTTFNSEDGADQTVSSSTQVEDHEAAVVHAGSKERQDAMSVETPATSTRFDLPPPQNLQDGHSPTVCDVARDTVQPRGVGIILGEAHTSSTDDQDPPGPTGQASASPPRTERSHVACVNGASTSSSSPIAHEIGEVPDITHDIPDPETRVVDATLCDLMASCSSTAPSTHNEQRPLAITVSAPSGQEPTLIPTFGSGCPKDQIAAASSDAADLTPSTPSVFPEDGEGECSPKPRGTSSSRPVPMLNLTQHQGPRLRQITRESAQPPSSDPGINSPRRRRWASEQRPGLPDPDALLQRYRAVPLAHPASEEEQQQHHPHDDKEQEEEAEPTAASPAYPLLSHVKRGHSTSRHRRRPDGPPASPVPAPFDSSAYGFITQTTRYPAPPAAVTHRPMMGCHDDDDGVSSLEDEASTGKPLASSLPSLFTAFRVWPEKGAGRSAGSRAQRTSFSSVGISAPQTAATDRPRPPEYSGPPLLPPQRKEHEGRPSLVLDLDETLVHSSFVEIENYAFIIPVEIEGTIHTIYVAKRPGVEAFLDAVARHYEVVIFTASLAKYADPLMERLDPKGLCCTRLFRESCVYWNGQFIKDLSRLGRDIRRLVIVDNSAASYAFQPDNAIPIESWFDNEHDTELYALIPLLTALAKVDDIPSVMRQTTRPSSLAS